MDEQIEKERQEEERKSREIEERKEFDKNQEEETPSTNGNQTELDESGKENRQFEEEKKE